MHTLIKIISILFALLVLFLSNSSAGSGCGSSGSGGCGTSSVQKPLGFKNPPGPAGGGGCCGPTKSPQPAGAVKASMYQQTTQPVKPQKPAIPILPEGNVWKTADGTKWYTCPVMDVDEKVEDAMATCQYGGVTFHLSTPECVQPFKSEPVKYLKALVIPANIESVDSKGVKQYRDPIDGSVGSLLRRVPLADYKGRRYYFTSNKNRDTFLAKPTGYASVK